MSTKNIHILHCAMAILKASGDQGLTMRKVAEAADMRLSNVQYYFKTKELLVAALLDGFLVDYAQSIQSIQSLSLSEQAKSDHQMHDFILYILNDIENSDCAVVFKEIWSIAGRNALVKKSLDNYYKKLHIMLFNALKAIAPAHCNDQQLDNAVGLLLPFIEGYCITFTNLKVSTTVLSAQLARILAGLLK